VLFADGGDVGESLEELLARCGRGEADAVAELVNRFAASAQDLARAILGDVHHAEDAVQAAFSTALERLPQLREAASFPAWLRQIVRSQANRIHRRRRDRPQELTAEAQSPGPSPQQCAESAERERAVRAALAALPPAGRRTAELYYLRQFTQADVARLLKVPEGTVKRRLHDARRRLRNMLLGHVSDESPRPPTTGPPL
jgi:RNA polymerase sigma factor (sigma-70 family)